MVDFQNSDTLGRVRLTTNGARQSISENSIELIEGKSVMLDDGYELRNMGILRFSKEENIWVAEFDDNAFTYY